MKRIIVFIWAVSLFSSANCESYHNGWVPVGGNLLQKDALTYDILESSVTCYKVRITVNGLYDQVESNGNIAYHHLFLEGNQRLTYAGTPALPVITQSVAIPSGATHVVSIEEESWEDLSMGLVYPAQEPRLESETAKEFKYDEDIYAKPFLPDLLHVGEEMKWRGISYVNIAVCPFKYYAFTQKLSVLKTFVIRVDFSHSQIPDNPDSPLIVDNSYRIFNNVDMGNSTERIEMLWNANTDEYDYLIIVGAGLTGILNSEAMRQFRWWKSLKGLKTKVVTTSVTGNTDTSIKYYIAQERQKGIKYVLFVGDADQVPLHLHSSFAYPTGSVASDYWYGCLGGYDNVIADVAIGRFSTNSVNEFNNMVNKTISYEKYYNATNQVLMVAHLEDAPNGYQLCCDGIINGNYTEPVTFKKAYGADSSHGGTNATNDSVIQAINNGVNIVNYRGHGGNDFWAKTIRIGENLFATMWNYNGQVFYSTEIDSMSQSSNAVFFSVACNNGNINSTCMLETFTRSSHGAAAFIGATIETNTDANDTYNTNLFAKLLNSNVYHIGELNNAAHIQSINYGFNYAPSKDCAYSYICGGDPSLEIWTSTPAGLGEVSIESQNDSIIINVGNPGTYSVSIADDDGEFVQTFNASGNRLSVPKLLDKFYLSIYRHNVSPYVAYYDSESESIQDKTFTIDSYYEHSPLVIGEYVDPQGEIGPVVVKSGTKLSIRIGAGGTAITDCFECEKGAVLIIK